MALKSILFRGDAKLEAAATTDSAHITKGAAGEHVRKIQYAIANVLGEPLKFDGKYGPATAAAVLAFKRRYKIVNRAYQSTPDDIVGVMTMAALDKEMTAIESVPGRAPVITCSFRRARLLPRGTPDF